ncbi:MAG: Abi family protein [Acetobacter sp.]|nr:Abi family protein [Acetobacter sp.]
MISDLSSAEETLSKINYYRLSAYFLPFKETNGAYVSGTTFEKIVRIYEFDREIRSFLFRAIACFVPLNVLKSHYVHAFLIGTA